MFDNHECYRIKNFDMANMQTQIQVAVMSLQRHVFSQLQVNVRIIPAQIQLMSSNLISDIQLKQVPFQEQQTQTKNISFPHRKKSNVSFEPRSFPLNFLTTTLQIVYVVYTNKIKF